MNRAILTARCRRRTQRRATDQTWGDGFTSRPTTAAASARETPLSMTRLKALEWYRRPLSCIKGGTTPDAGTPPCATSAQTPTYAPPPPTPPDRHNPGPGKALRDQRVWRHRVATRLARRRSRADWPSTPGARVGAGPTVLVLAYHHRSAHGSASQVRANRWSSAPEL